MNAFKGCPPMCHRVSRFSRVHTPLHARSVLGVLRIFKSFLRAALSGLTTHAWMHELCTDTRAKGVRKLQCNGCFLFCLSPSQKLVSQCCCWLAG